MTANSPKAQAITMSLDDHEALEKILARNIPGYVVNDTLCEVRVTLQTSDEYDDEDSSRDVHFYLIDDFPVEG